MKHLGSPYLLGVSHTCVIFSCIKDVTLIDLAFASGAFFTRRAQALAQPAFHLTFAFLENLRETMSERAGEVE